MKILVLGATGGTGRLIVREALAQGHTVVAVVRSRSRAAAASEGVEWMEGDARDEELLARSLIGCSAVISSIGTSMSPFRRVTLLSESARALVSAMTRSGVRRLVCITGLGAGDSRGHGGAIFDWFIFPLLLREVYHDKDRQESIIRASDRDWILVRPVVLTDKPARGQVRALQDLSGIQGGSISRADVAKFVVGQLEHDQWLRRAPLITW